MEHETMRELELLRRMYAVVCGGADQALTLLEAGNVWDAKRTLSEALERAEELYLSADGSTAGNVLDTFGES